MNKASEALNSKAVGAMFSILHIVNKHMACRIDTLLQLFDKMVLPISLYNCEVWGTNFLPVNAKNDSLLGKQFLYKHIAETLQNKFLKMILGLPQKASNWAVASETGRYPVAIKAFTSMIKFYFHLSGSPSYIVRQALDTNKQLSENGINSWYKYIHRLLKFCNLEHLLFTCDEKEITFQLNKLKKTFQTKYIGIWNQEKDSFSQDSKLELFTSLKSDFGLSEYLIKCGIPSHRASISRIRVSAHNFPIERGRYLETPREDRLCPFGCNFIGDELHYLLQCSHPFISDVQVPLVQKIQNLHPEFLNFNPKQKLTFILNNKTPEILGIVGKLCKVVQETFKEMVY
jgi:hypothetical protein